MKLSRNYTDASLKEKDAQEMQDEIEEVTKWLKKYTSNIDSLLFKNSSKEVKKAMINFLVEQL